MLPLSTNNKFFVCEMSRVPITLCLNGCRSKRTVNRNPLKPDGKCMYQLLYQLVAVHFIFMGLVCFS
jgi:hypothetical protein